MFTLEGRDTLVATRISEGPEPEHRSVVYSNTMIIVCKLEITNLI